MISNSHKLVYARRSWWSKAAEANPVQVSWSPCDRQIGVTVTTCLAPEYVRTLSPASTGGITSNAVIRCRMKYPGDDGSHDRTEMKGLP